jgi:hypothetical protein
MARMLREQYYDVQKNILDKIGDDSPMDSKTIKGLAGLFTVDVLKRLVERHDNRMSDNITKIKNDEIIRTGRNDELWKRRNKVLEDNKLIQEQGAETFFDAQAESLFNNPKTHENSDILKDNPDWTFSPDEFADRNSPMYKVKQGWKRDYINTVLLPQHKNKYEQIDQNILTFDEYNRNNRETTKHSLEYAKRPEESSFFRQWNLFGKKRTAALKSKYENAKKAEQNILLEREGYLVGDTTTKPLSSLTKKMYETGEVYNEFEFRNTEEYKKLSLQGQKRATELFRRNEEYGDKNNTYELLNIFTSVQLLENEQSKILKYDSIKYNDPDFAQAKPIRQKNQTRVMYENSQAYQEWKQGVDSAYEKGSAKDIQARQRAGYNLTRSDDLNLAIDENIEYIAELREDKRQFDAGKMTEDKYNEKVEAYKDKTISNIIEKELGTTDKIQSFIEGMQEDRVNSFLTALRTPAGLEAIDTWTTRENQRRESKGLPKILPSQKEDIYRSIHIQHILDDSAYLYENLLINPETGRINIDTEELQEYNISTDSL